MKTLNLTIALMTCLALLATGLVAQTDRPSYDEYENLGYLEITIQTDDGKYVIRGVAEGGTDQWPVVCTDPGGISYSDVVGHIEEDAGIIFGGTVSFEGAGDYEIYLLKPMNREDPPCIDCLPTYDPDAVAGKVLDGGGMDVREGRFADLDRKAREGEADHRDLGNIPGKQPNFEVFVEPVGPTAVSSGEDLAFQIGVWNHENVTVSGDLWIVVSQLTGHEVVIPGDRLGYSAPMLDEEVPPGFFELDDNVLTVPVRAMTGTYNLKAKFGEYPDITIDEDSFEFYVVE